MSREGRSREAVAYRDTGLCYSAEPLVALSEAVFAIAATFGVAKVQMQQRQ